MKSFNFQFAALFAYDVGGGTHLNYCMIATGNHRYFDSLLDAPRPGRMQFVFAEIRCEIVTLYRRAVEGAGPYNDIRRTSTNYNLTNRFEKGQPLAQLPKAKSEITQWAGWLPR